MPLSPEEIMRRRVINRAKHYAARRAAARTPMERAAAAWDQWRRLLAEMPSDRSGAYAEVIATALETHINQIAREG